MTTNNIIGLCNALAQTRVNALSSEGRIALVNLMHELKNVSRDFEQKRKDAIEQLKADNHDDMVQMYNNGNEAEKKEAQSYLNTLSAQVNEVLAVTLNTETDIDTHVIDDQDFWKIAEQGNWTLTQLEDLKNTLTI